MAADPAASAGDPGSATERLRDDLRAVLPSFLAARLLVVVAWLLGIAVIDWAVPGGRTAYQLEGLTGWDAGFYRDIAVRGYEGLTTEALRFFPLYPLLGRLLIALPGSTELALVLVANAAALTAGILLRRLVLFERGPGATALAERAVWVLNLSPASFVLVWGYAEGLFVALAVGTVLAARRGWFVVAGACAFGAAMTRPIGVLLAAPILVEAARPWISRLGGTRSLSDLTPREGAARLWALAAPVLGLGLFLGWVGRTFGDPMLPLTIQSGFRTTMDPLHRLGRGLIDMVGSERFGDGLHIPFVLAFVALLVVVARRWPVSYTLYAALVLLVTFSSDNLNSTERYGLLNAFPLLLGLADVLDTRRKERIALAVCANGFVALCALAWTGVYVP